MRDGHDDVEIGKVLDQFGAAGLDPFLRLCPLAGGAAAVPAGSIVDLFIAAFWADALCESRTSGLAHHDALGRAFLFRGNHMSFTAGRIEHPECFTDKIIRHCLSPPYLKGW